MKPLPKTGKAVGIDVGLENLLALSDGTLLENPRWLKATKEKIALKQRILSRRLRVLRDGEGCVGKLLSCTLRLPDKEGTFISSWQIGLSGNLTLSPLKI
jgi:hypothetical protein